MTDWLLPFLCGLGAAVISAWGVGGGTLLLLVMTLFLGVDQRMAQGINLLFFLPAAAAALLFHRRRGALDAAVLRRAALPGALAALAGAAIAALVDVSLLRRPFGLFLLYAGGTLLFSRGKARPGDEATAKKEEK